MTPAELERFDIASSHRYDCKCDYCKEWWKAMPPEEEDEDEEK